MSQISTERRQRPSICAALRPAGPAPTMTTSNTDASRLTDQDSRGSRARPAWSWAKRGSSLIDAEIGIAADPCGGERGLDGRHALERVEGAISIATQRVQVRDVVAGERIVRALGDARLERLQRVIEVALRLG